MHCKSLFFGFFVLFFEAHDAIYIKKLVILECHVGLEALLADYDCAVGVGDCHFLDRKHFFAFLVAKYLFGVELGAVVVDDFYVVARLPKFLFGVIYCVSR